MSEVKPILSKKYVKIWSYNTFIHTKAIDGKLMLHTANGIYIGSMKLPEDSDNLDLKESDDIPTMAKKLYIKYLENDRPDEIEEISENPITIDLINVELITPHKTISMPFASIFVDQVIGISIGTFNNSAKE